MPKYAQVNSPWSKGTLISLWGIQIFFTSTFVILLGVLISITAAPAQTGKVIFLPQKGIDYVEPGAQIWTIVDLVLAILALIFNCLEVTIFSFGLLNPAWYMWSSLGRLLAWLIGIILTAYAANTYRNQESAYHQFPISSYGSVSITLQAVYLYIAIGWATIIFVSLIASLIYSVVVFRKDKTRVKGKVNDYMADESSATSYPYYQ